jgi:hypothetical protein
MDYQEAENIFQIIKSSKLQGLSDLFIKSAIRYAQLRVEWYFANPEERIELDLVRTRAHEALISNCNALSRNMKESGEDDAWRYRLGNDRKRIGDFACFVYAILGISAR